MEEHKHSDITNNVTMAVLIEVVKAIIVGRFIVSFLPGGIARTTVSAARLPMLVLESEATAVTRAHYVPHIQYSIRYCTF